MADPLTLLAAGVGGGLVGLGASYFVFYSRPKPRKVKGLQRDEAGALRSTSFSPSELEKSRREMRTMMVERDLLSSALMKLYEAESEGRITREEREMVTKRYSEQIKSIQSKLKDVELVVEVGELEKLREELVSLFKEKIQNIEARLDQAKERLTPVAPEVVAKQAGRRAEREEELEKVVERKVGRPEMSEAERRVRQIRDEVMDALTKLEQIDVEKKQQDKT